MTGKRKPAGHRAHAAKRGGGVPRAVEKRPGGKPVVGLDMTAARETWLLDLLAWIRHGQVAARIDLRGPRSPLPPVVLPANDSAHVIGLESATAVRKLRSRHRAFSQIAGRYSPLVVGARDSGASVIIEIWDTQEAGTTDDLGKLADQLAEYLQASVTLHNLSEARALLAELDISQLPQALVARNPIAWACALTGPPP